MWIVMSAIYLVIVIAFAVNLFPESKPGISDEERFKRTVELINEYLNIHSDFREQPPILRSEFGAIAVNLVIAWKVA